MTLNQKTSQATTPRAPVAVLHLGWLVAAALALVLLRMAGIDSIPIVLADEYSYQSVSLAYWLGQPWPYMAARIDNWIYIGLYSLVHLGNGDPLTLARTFNAVLAALVVIPIVLIAKDVGHWRAGVLASMVFAVLFMGGMTPYFKPETMQTLGVAVMVLALHRYAIAASWVNLALLTAASVFTGLAKSHGVLLLPAMAVVIVFAQSSGLERGWGKRLGHAAVLVICALVSMALVRGLISGEWRLNPIGDFYSGLASSTLLTKQHGMDQYLAVATNHLAIIAMLAALPLAFGVISAMRCLRIGQRVPNSSLPCINLFLLGSLAGMAILAITFTVGVAGHGPYETIARIHGRYYEHLLVLAAIFGALSASEEASALSVRTRWVVGGLVIASVISAWQVFQAPSGWWSGIVDFTAAFGLVVDSHGILIAVALALALTLAVMVFPNRATAFAILGLSFWLAFNAYHLERVRWSIADNPVDIAGRVLAAIEHRPERAKITIVTPMHSGDFFRMAYWLMEEDVDSSIQSQGQCGDHTARSRWIVYLGTPVDGCGDKILFQLDGVVVLGSVAMTATVINAAIPADQIGTRLALTAPPRYAPREDKLVLAVRVHNDGKATLVSQGSAPVRLGAMLLGTDGVDRPPGLRDFIRAELPVIAPGAMADLELRLPAAALLGLPVRLELVQEGVNWFSVYGQAPLDVGTFNRCARARAALCDARGNPLPP